VFVLPRKKTERNLIGIQKIIDFSKTREKKPLPEGFEPTHNFSAENTLHTIVSNFLHTISFFVPFFYLARYALVILVVLQRRLQFTVSEAVSIEHRPLKSYFVHATSQTSKSDALEI
jgi:hypothetical protein